MKVIIMAGGRGTRISSIRADVPKPMIEIGGKPILQYQIENLRASGLTDIVLVIGYLGNVIREYFKDGSAYGVKISYFEENKPLGTAGALFKMGLKDDFLLLCGDIIFDIDFSRFIEFHRKNDAWASLVAHPNGHPYDSSVLVTEVLQPNVPGGMPINTNRVITWISKEDSREYYRNLVNAGIQIISPKLISEILKQRELDKELLPEKLDLDRDLLKPCINTGKIFAYVTPEYIKDMGTPDRYYETEIDIKTGKVQQRNLRNKQKAIFLDRDGTINVSNGFITRTEDFNLANGVADAIKKINKSGYLAIVVTNQPVIARGDCTFNELQNIHNKMETELGRVGAYLDGIYFCPHHTDSGFPGERKEYKYKCDCRKPNAGLLFQAASRFNIDLAQSYMIGDSENDILAGEKAGCKESILVTDENTVLNIVDKILAIK